MTTAIMDPPTETTQAPATNGEAEKPKLAKPLSWIKRSDDEYRAISNAAPPDELDDSPLEYVVDRPEGEWMIDNSPNDLVDGEYMGPFDTPEAAKAACQEIEERHAQAVQAEADQPQTPAEAIAAAHDETGERAFNDAANPPRAEPLPPAIDPELWQEILKTRTAQGEAAFKVATLTEQLKSAKKWFESTSEQLGQLIDQAADGVKEPMLPFGNNGHANNGKTGTAADAIKEGLDKAAEEKGTAWRFVRLAELEPKITEKKLAMLTEHEPPITTIGELSDWQGTKGEPWWWKDIKGFGERGRDQVIAALDRYWAKHPQPKAEEPKPAEAAEPDVEGNRVIPKTVEDVLEIPNCTICVGRRVNETWATRYTASVGEAGVNTSGEWVGSYPDRAGAVNEAVTIIGDWLRNQNPTNERRALSEAIDALATEKIEESKRAAIKAGKKGKKSRKAKVRA